MQIYCDLMLIYFFSNTNKNMISGMFFLEKHIGVRTIICVSAGSLEPFMNQFLN